MNPTKDVAALLGRMLLALIFVVSGFGKIADFAGTAGYIASKGLPLPEVGVVLAIVVELGGGLMLVFGWKARWAALALAVFTIFASIFFHNFWTMTGEEVLTNQIMFFKNLAMIGGMLMVWAFGPGRYSVDRWRGASAWDRPTHADASPAR
jgi:putative oxidoreductase